MLAALAIALDAARAANRAYTAVLAASADTSNITAAYTAHTAAAFTVDSADSAAARADFDALLSMNLGEFSECGPPIDPSEDGPLGPLWPDGVPEWFSTLATGKPAESRDVLDSQPPL